MRTDDSGLIMSLQLYFLFLITLLGAIPNSKASPDVLKNKETVKFLITSNTGMLFHKAGNPDGSTSIIYDCSLGVLNEGIVNIYDKLHPENTEAVIIENCDNITLRICVQEGEIKVSPLRELLVKNINTLTFFTGCKNSYGYNFFPDMFHPLHYSPYYEPEMSSKRFYISNVGNLVLLEESCSNFPNVALTIENTTIGNLYSTAISRGVATLKLQNVEINRFEENGIYLNDYDKYFNRVLIIKDSHFGNVNRKIIYVNGSEVEICNNSFQYLGDDVFTINATEKFNFSDNYIRKMEAPFNVRSSNIHIKGNTFDINKKPWITGLKVKSEQESGVLSIKENSMSIYFKDDFAMDPASQPDVITFDHNNFNCTCQYFHYEEFEKSWVSAFLLRKKSNNVCANLGNCPLRKALRHMNDICEGTFTCSEVETPKVSTETYLQMILSTLKDMQEILHSLASKAKLFTFSNEIDKIKEESITTRPDGMIP